MTKREKQERIISHLQILRTWCAVNPDYGKGLSIDDCHKAVEWLDDALDLLKAQEPVKPEVYFVGPDKYKFYRCPVCKIAWYHKGNYCLGCGMAVKWE